MSNADDHRQMKREATALRWMFAAGLVYGCFELTRLADRIAAMFDTPP